MIMIGEVLENEEDDKVEKENDREEHGKGDNKTVNAQNRLGSGLLCEK